MSAIQFALNHFPVTFEAKLLFEDESVRDLTGNTKLEVILVRPDGTELRKVAAAKDPGSLTDTEITYTNSAAPSILDQNGYWEFYVAATFGSNGLIPSYQRIGFWVS